jgi:hypothetical protein
MKGRYRNKLNKIVAEVFNGDRWIYIKTLSDPLIDFPQECHAKVSLKEPVLTQKDTQKCAQSPLNEPLKIDTKEDLLKKMKEIQNKIDSEILGTPRKDLPNE